MASRNQVTVACKIPNGLILRLFKTQPMREAALGGGTREYMLAVEDQSRGRVKLEGPSFPFGAVPRYDIKGGYALTHVDAEFWAEWLKQNAEHDAVKNHLVFAHEKTDYVFNKAKDQEAVLSGLEPLNVEVITKEGRQRLKDERVKSLRPPGMKSPVSDITTAPRVDE